MGSVDTAWASWTSDVEQWLRASQALTNEKAEHAIGSTPSLRSGSHRVAGRQSVAERSLRRHIRRLKKAQLHCRRGRVPPEGLIRSLSNLRLPEPESLAISEGRLVEPLVLLVLVLTFCRVSNTTQLLPNGAATCKALLRRASGCGTTKLLLRSWNCRMAQSSLSRPLLWSTCPALETVLGQHEQHGEPSAALQRFWDKYEGDLCAPQLLFPALQPIRSGNIRKAVQKMLHLSIALPFNAGWPPDRPQILKQRLLFMNS